MRNRIPAGEQLTEHQRDRLVAFLREWLPEEAKGVYRDMIRSAPSCWWQDPHFDGGIILEFALRGNGFNEKSLGVLSLEPLWPDLLASAVEEDITKHEDAAENVGESEISATPESPRPSIKE